MRFRNLGLVAAMVMFSLCWAAWAEQRPGWTGMAITPSPAETRAPWLHVRHVTAGGPAEAAGIRDQDVITHINRKPVSFKSDLEVLQFFGSLKPGEKVKFTVRRTAGVKVLTVVTVPMPDAAYERWKQIMARVQADEQARE